MSTNAEDGQAEHQAGSAESVPASPADPNKEREADAIYQEGELVARVKAQLRRVRLDTEPPSDGVLRGGDVELDGVNRALKVRGQPVTLTAKEFDLLHHLMKHPGEVFSRDDLLDSVWDRSFVGGPATVTVHVRRLREKIERDPSRPSHLKVVWGTGYKFDPG